jgi:hypothetical protein
MEYDEYEITQYKTDDYEVDHLIPLFKTPQDVVLNQEIIAVIANQIAGKAAREPDG